MSKGGNFLGRIQLYSKGSAINHGLVSPGEYGIPEGDERKSPAWARASTCSPSPDESRPSTCRTWKISASSMTRPTLSSTGSRKSLVRRQWLHVWGLILVFERSQRRFLELFFGTVTARSEVGKMYPFLPQVVDGVPQPPRVVTLTSRVIEKGNYSWHGSNIAECSTPIAGLPDIETITVRSTASSTRRLRRSRRSKRPPLPNDVPANNTWDQS